MGGEQRVVSTRMRGMKKKARNVHSGSGKFKGTQSWVTSPSM